MDKITAVVADDEPDAIEILSNLLKDTGKVEILAQVTSSFKIESTVNKVQPDVLFLDIEMPDQNGLALLENIREYNHDLRVVFVTAYQKYLAEAIKLNVFSYLQKPVNRLELQKMVNALVRLKVQSAKNFYPQKIKLPINDGYVYLKPKELFVLEADGNYTRIKTASGEEFVSSYNMGRLFSKLPLNGFYRISRNSILNGEYIYKINKKLGICIARVNNEFFEFEISKTFISQFNKTLF